MRCARPPLKNARLGSADTWEIQSRLAKTVKFVVNRGAGRIRNDESYAEAKQKMEEESGKTRLERIGAPRASDQAEEKIEGLPWRLAG